MSTVKDFLLKVANDEEMGKGMQGLLGNTVASKLSRQEQEEIIQNKVIPFAKKHGYEFSVADFMAADNDEDEIPDDEIEAVSGGSSCYCFIGGGGSYDEYYSNQNEPNSYQLTQDLTCACVGGGGGQYKDVTSGSLSERCACVAYGEGDGYNTKSGDYKE